MIYFKILFITNIILSANLLSQTTGNRTVALTLPVVTLMDIEPAGTITLNFTAPTEAGRPVTAPPSNTTKWINYTSAISQGGVTRRITASISQVLSGIDIKIQAGSASGAGGGILGIPNSQITLNNTSQTIINGIGGAFTGNGTNNGHQLTISLTANSYGNLSARTNTPIVITYTITE